MQAHRNPTRRNRNIGTAKQGHGQNNSLVIPNRNDGLNWLDRIDDFSVTVRNISGRSVRFIVEIPKLYCVHPCSVSDVAHVLGALPGSDWAGIDAFIFRQPSRKQLLLSPAWGRLVYSAEITTLDGRPVLRGPTIYLDAIQPNKTMKWSTSLDPDDSTELQRLREDRHEISRSGRKHIIAVSASSARRTQLSRTLLHEIGHWFDWLSKVEEPAARGEDFKALVEAYFARPKAEREAFAHRYADTQRTKLESSGVIPFEPMI